MILVKEIMRRASSNPEIAKEIEKLLGANKVSYKLVDLISYSHDYWPISFQWLLKGNVPALPDVVVFPDSTQDLIKVVKFANERDVPIYVYGGGSGVLGAAVPEYGGIVIDMKKFRDIEINAEDMFVKVGAGVNGMVLENFLNRYGYTLGHFPQSIYTSTVGGWISTKAIGQFSVKYGGIEDMLLGLEAIIPPGELLSFKPDPRAAVGPDLKSLFIESEGLFGIITKAYLKIWPYPEKRVLLSYASKDLEEALRSVREVMISGAKPAVIRVYDKVETLKWFHMAKKAKGKVGTIMILEGNKELVEAERRIVENAFASSIPIGEEPVKYWLENRFNVKEISDYLPLGIIIDTIEVAIGWSNAINLYNDTINAIRDVDGTLIAFAHASHFYPQGVCFYFIFGGLPSKEKGVLEYYNEVWSSVMKVVIKYNGAISHHHGIGRMRSSWIRESIGDVNFNLLKRIKEAIDKKNIMNRGNMVI